MAKRPTILLVEDDPGARRLFVEAIADESNAELIIATDGSDALNLLPQRNGKDDLVPDLVVLDLDLPNIDGMTVLKEYRASTSPTNRVPILILSGNDDQAVIDEAYELGANAYLAKPDDYDDLVELIRDVGDFWLNRVSCPSN